ncbi:MAG: hypothetical protein JXA69_09420 [Phycisphaerae bacterium]|nr:hypothetical protein [Phycisphaerae bacterium]
MAQNQPGGCGDTCYHLGGRLGAELICHLPFSISSVVLGLILAGIICFLAPPEVADPAVEPQTQAAHAEAESHTGHHHAQDAHEGHAHEFHGQFIELFHLFHPAHMLFSAAATTAMFCRYDRRWFRAILVGLTGAIVVCGLSDIVMPHMSLWLLGRGPDHWHICIIQHPQLVLPFAVVGVGLGFLAAVGIERSTFYSHSLHVFVSTMASIFYLVGPLGRLAWIDDIGKVFFFIALAVMLPCCCSDILYPVLLSRGGREAYAKGSHAHVH